MKQYLENPFIWGVLPIVCSLSYNVAPGPLTFIYMGLFPAAWIAAGYYTYKSNELVKKTLLKLHIPILICYIFAVIHAVWFGMEMGFIESNNEIIGLEGSIAQNAFAPMSIAGVIEFFPRNHVMFYPTFYTSALILMFGLSYLGMAMKKNSRNINAQE